MSKKIYFDLDGTVYDLYNVENWLEKLRSETEKVFTEGNFLGNYDNFLSAICQLIGYGYSFGVISWLPMYATPEFENECAEVKRKWVQKYLPFVEEINFQRYGTPKQNAIQTKAQIMYLIDDCIEVGRVWETPKQRKYIYVDEGCNAVVALKYLLTND